MTTTLVNFRTVAEHWNKDTRQWDNPQYYYIGRGNPAYNLPTSAFANPFKIIADTTENREAAVHQYRPYIVQLMREIPALKAELEKMRGKTFVCWCSPKRCHGEVLLELLGEQPVIVNEQQIGFAGNSAGKPVFAWETTGNPTDAMYPIGMDKHNRLYRDKQVTLSNDNRIKDPIGEPGKIYTNWMDWYRDYLKLSLRVRGQSICLNMTNAEYARIRYTTRFYALEDEIAQLPANGELPSRQQIECEILRELLEEIAPQLFAELGNVHSLMEQG